MYLRAMIFVKTEEKKKINKKKDQVCRIQPYAGAKNVYFGCG